MRCASAVRVFTLALVMAMVPAACSNGAATSNIGQGIRGVVLAGPQCPVESTTSPCPPRPLSGAEVEVTNAGGVVAKVTTDEQGTFVVALDPGTYAVQATPGQSGFMTSRPVSVEVRPGTFARITVPVDTGIR